MKKTALFISVLVAFLTSGGGEFSRADDDDNGRPRIVSLAPSLTEIVCALDPTVLVGRTSACNYPPEIVKKVTVVGGFGVPSMETLVSVRPTLILDVDLEDEAVGARMDTLGLRRKHIPFRKLGDIPAGIRAVGESIGRGPESAVLADRIATGIEGLQAETGTNPPLVFVEIWNDPVTTAGTNSFISELVRLAGGRNAGDTIIKDYAEVSAEWVVAANPDIIICADMVPGGSPAGSVRKRAGWKNIKAVKNNRIHDNINPDVVLRPGPRVLEGVAELRACLLGKTVKK